MLVNTAFISEAFIVAKGQKTPYMLELESQAHQRQAQARQASGLPATTQQQHPDPDPANLQVVEKLAGVLKFFAGDDTALLAATKIRFKDHFSGVLTNGQLVIEPACDGLFDSAAAEDITYKDLRKVGMNKYGDPMDVETLGNWIKSRTYNSCIPNGGLADDYVACEKLMELDESICGGKVEWNEMDKAITINRVPIEDSKTTGGIRVRIGSTYSVPAMGKRGMRRFVPSDASVFQALESIARNNKYHPAQEWLLALDPWDGADYAPMMLQAIGGMRDEAALLAGPEKEQVKASNDLAVSQLLKFFIGAVARTMNPGCQMDTMLVLKSNQGTKKSSLFRAWAPAERFTSTHFEFGSKDSRMLFSQNTIIEIAELSAFQKRDVQLIKAEITERGDEFRLPFGRVMTRNPRHCVFVGSTNDDTFLRDQTGSRRFWVIVVDDNIKLDIDLIKRLAPLLWAQALHLYMHSDQCPDCAVRYDGEDRCVVHRWWLSVEEDRLREKINQQFTEVEPYVEAVQAWIHNETSDKNTAKQGLHTAVKNTDALRVAELLKEVIGLPEEKCHEMHHQKRMAYALKVCGYIKKHTEKGSLWISPGMQKRPDLYVVPKPATKASTVKAPTSDETLKASGDDSKPPDDSSKGGA